MGLRFFALLLAATAIAQDLDPAVILLARIKVHMREELSHLPNYTCLETINRFHQPPNRSKFDDFDSVRLEIVYSGGREWYGAPGDRELSIDNPAAFVASGMIANGLFATTLHNLFISDRAMFTAEKEDGVPDAPALRYHFRLPGLFKPLQVTLHGAFGTVGEEGTIWVDPQSLDVVRMEFRAAEIPPYLPLTLLETGVRFARTRIGEFDALVAQHATMQIIDPEGQDYDRFDFTHCRAFHGNSTISYDRDPLEPGSAPPDAPRRIVAPAEPETSVPALLAITVDLTSPITETYPVGKLIAGRVVGDVVRKGSVIIKDGAPVRGRIRRLDRQPDLSTFIVGLEFTEIEARGAPLRFYADILRIAPAKGVRIADRERVMVAGRRGESFIVLPELPGVASFFVEGKHFTLPAGFRTVWRTRGLLRGM